MIAVDDGALDLRIIGSRVDELVFTMDPPLELAGRQVPTREYVVVQVELEDGTTGTAYVLTRGQKIGAAAEERAQQAIGRPLRDLFHRADRGPSTDQRASAVLDCVGWDLLGKVHQVPTWKLLGEAAPHRPALLVAGYRRRQESDLAMAERLVGWRERGYRAIKIASGLDVDRTTGLLAAVRDLASPEDLQLVLDLGFGGREVTAIVDATRAWESFGITWVEDPIPVAAASDMAAIRAASPLPIAAGDEAPLEQLSDLLEHSAVDVLRADATTVGGLTGVQTVLENASVPVSLHIYPEIHRHAAFVMTTDSPVELFPADDAFDFVDRFIHTQDLQAIEGQFSAPSSPGLGITYRPEHVLPHVVRSSSFGHG